MKPRLVRIALFGVLAGAALLLPTSRGVVDGGDVRMGASSASLLIPAKTRLIITYTRRALA